MARNINHYNSIQNLPYWNFQQVRKTEDVKYLYELDSYLGIDKLPHNPELSTVFEEILNEYNDSIMSRKDVQFHFELDQEIGEYQSEHFAVANALFLLEITHNREGFSDELQKAIDALDHFDYDIDLKQPLKPQLQSIIGQNDSLLNDIDDVEAQKKTTKGTPPTEEEFHQALEKYRGGNVIDKRIISVAQYIAYENDFLKHIEDASNKAKPSNR